jgi:triosephosphate isomerase
VWEWIETKNELIKKGYVPPIHDFSITKLNGEDMTEKFLSEEGYRILIVQEQLKNSLPKGQKNLNALVSQLMKDKEVRVWALTASLETDIKTYSEENKVNYPFYNTDQTTLKSIIRSNPGVLLLKNNLILKKWPSRRIPEAREVYKYLYK